MRYTPAVILLAFCGFLGISAPSRAAEPANLKSIVSDLGSDNFATRESAQQRLGDLPPESLESLRGAEQAATHKEVQVRLRTAINDLEIKAILHPHAVSLDVKDANLADVAKALNQQLGGKYITGVSIDPRVTLRVDNQPLWEILRQLNEKVPLQVRYNNGADLSDLPMTMTILPLAGEPRKVTVADGAAVRPEFAVDPATGEWTLYCIVSTDPRVLVARYALAMKIEKAVDQDGKPLSVLPSASAEWAAPVRPVCAFVTGARFAAAPNARQIGELRATVSINVAEKEDILHFDLANLPKEPVETAAGKFIIEPNGNDYAFQNLTAHGPTARVGPGIGPEMRQIGLVLSNDDACAINLRIFDEGGGMFAGTFTTTSHPTTKIMGAMGDRVAATVEMSVAGKTRRAEIHIVLHDVRLPGFQ